MLRSLTPTRPAMEATFTMLPSRCASIMDPKARRENEGCDEVNLKHAAERGGFDGLGGSDEADACVVDEDVGTAPALRDEGDSPRDQSLIGDVADDLFCFRASRTQSGERGFTRLHIEQQKGVTGLAQNLGRSAADALGRSRNNGNSHIFTLFQRCTRHICGNTLRTQKIEVLTAYLRSE